MLAVCGGYQLLGHSYELADGESLPGLGLVDLRTVREPGPRLIGNVVIEADLGDGAERLAGFENHGGRTYLGDGETAARPGRVRLRQQRPGRLRGRAARAADRHLPARPAAAQERVARRRPDRAGRSSARLRAECPRSSRSTTRSSGAHTTAPFGRPGASNGRVAAMATTTVEKLEAGGLDAGLPRARIGTAGPAAARLADVLVPLAGRDAADRAGRTARSRSTCPASARSDKPSACATTSSSSSARSTTSWRRSRSTRWRSPSTTSAARSACIGRSIGPSA